MALEGRPLIVVAIERVKTWGALAPPAPPPGGAPQ
jgi:hypothetical protein